MICHLVNHSLQAVRGGYLAVQSSWILFMSETGNNQMNVLIKYLKITLVLVAQVLARIRHLSHESLILSFFRSDEIHCRRAKDFAFTDAGTLKFGQEVIGKMT